MSPEQRAEKALEFIGWGCGLDACKEPDRPSCGCKAYLALAFKEAEDAAYERAAAHIMAGVAQDGKGSISVGDEILRHGAHWSAQRVLALKPQEP